MLSGHDGAGHDPAHPVYLDLQDASQNSAGSHYKIVADKGTDFRIWVDDKQRSPISANPYALGMRITSDVNGPIKDKIVLTLVPGVGPLSINPYIPDRTRYLSFDFMLPMDYQAPHGWLLHLQAFQCCGGVPPFTIHVKEDSDPSAPIEFLFCVADDDFRQHPVPGEAGNVIYSLGIPRGNWARMTLMLRPGPIGTPGPSGVAMWFNGRQMFDWSGHWGYTPQPDHINADKQGQNMAIDVGLYRRRQTRTQSIFVRNLKFGATYGSVASPD